MARALHAQGAAVALAGTRLAALESLASELGERTAVATADLSDPAAADALVKEVEGRLGASISWSTMPV